MTAKNAHQIKLFLCGDVMTGRAIDQVLPYPSDPMLFESYIKDARAYVDLAEQTSGPLTKPVDFSYIWGDALRELEHHRPDVRIINLETSITKSGDYWQGKGVHYRMHPHNIPCLTAAKIDCCALANNHVLDWGYAGLIETLQVLNAAKIKTTGAGLNNQLAQQPAIMEVTNKGRVLVYSCGSETSGVPWRWAAGEGQLGVYLLKDFSDHTVHQFKLNVSRVKQPGDLVVMSIHWGQNWGYSIPHEHTAFAHKLIDEAGVDIVHGHSSHHVKGIEVYKGKPIIYGCGDFLNDYEGIEGYEEFRDDLVLMYFVGMGRADEGLVSLVMVPMQIKRFKLNRASKEDSHWLAEVLNREGSRFGTGVEMDANNNLNLTWG